ncbi:MAG: hypothetical protein C4297_11935 [Gemmataceae bacterium]
MHMLRATLARYALECQWQAALFGKTERARMIGRDTGVFRWAITTGARRLTDACEPLGAIPDGYAVRWMKGADKAWPRLL